ncbi:2-hydroxyacid dehydrogenase [Pelagibius marinus]|uniref:2-hydroxyacid dehydrogenase n=1 Tax=Pelagibius marinus TaxID=2762760 RepID=UPI001872919B|nr:glyoxylate/hydroxypyruvate reductase A [Pelagibius marinus]
MSILFISDVDSFDNWDAVFRSKDPRAQLVECEDVDDPASIEYALAWNPPDGLLARLPRLKAIFSLGAGVDHILRDHTLPKGVPIVRAVDTNLAMRMAEYVVLHCLILSRQQRRLDAQQVKRLWVSELPVFSSDVRVGIMGLGHLGRYVAERLRDIGFQVAGWSTGHKEIPEVASFAGEGELASFLQRTDILVSLLPHTPKTHGFIGTSILRQLSRDGVLGGPAFISVGRGTVHVEDDIVEALDDGFLSAAVLDVFEREPLPEGSPLWRHPRVTVTPHCAAVTDPRSIVSSVLANIARLERGDSLENVVNVERGY